MVVFKSLCPHQRHYRECFIARERQRVQKVARYRATKGFNPRKTADGVKGALNVIERLIRIWICEVVRRESCGLISYLSEGRTEFDVG